MESFVPEESVETLAPPSTDHVRGKGHVLIELIDQETGKVKHREEIDNLIVTVGLAWFAKRLAAESANEMTHIAVGTSASATAAGQTALVGTELARVAMTSKTRTANAVAMVASYPAGTGTGTLNEAGIFDASSAGTMLSRVVFSGAVTKGASDIFNITWTISFSAV